MKTRELFTESEWRLLMFAPLWVFSGVAKADNEIDEDEMAALAQEVEDAEEYAEPLVREVFRSLREDDAVLQAYKTDDRDMDQGLAEVADLPQRKAQPEHAEALRRRCSTWAAAWPWPPWTNLSAYRASARKRSSPCSASRTSSACLWIEIRLPGPFSDIGRGRAPATSRPLTERARQ
jgi:hypothetical protein